MDSFRFTIYEVNILYVLLNELPKGGRTYQITDAMSSDATSISRDSISDHLKRMSRRGLIKKSGQRRRYVYEAVPIENPDVRKIFEEHDDPTKIYFALDKIWLELKGY